MKTTPNFSHYPALPYRNVRDLGKELPSPPAGDRFSREMEAISRLLFPDNSPQEDDEFVDDDGNVLPRKQLESGNE